MSSNSYTPPAVPESSNWTLTFRNFLIIVLKLAVNAILTNAALMLLFQNQFNNVTSTQGWWNILKVTLAVVGGKEASVFVPKLIKWSTVPTNGAAIVLCVLGAMFGMTGCNPSADVNSALTVANQVVSIAQADIPALQADGTLTAADSTALTNWLAGASQLITQGQTCTTASGGKSAVIVACVNAIGTGLLSPAEMADLRLISPKAQKQVTLYVTAVILAVDGAAAIVKAATTPVPAVGGSTVGDPIIGPTAAELHDLAVRAGAERYGF
jgi:hypothetical protein